MSEKKYINMIYGLNGSGKTTFLKKSVGLFLDHKIIKVDNILYFYNICEYMSDKKVIDFIYENTLYKSINYKKVLSSMFELNIFNNDLNKKMNSLSTGQKRKIYMFMIILEKNYIWFLDEPKNFLDKNSNIFLKLKCQRHKNIGGIIYKTEIIKKKNNTLNSISLSRFELLAIRLSSECSTTEL